MSVKTMLPWVECGHPFEKRWGKQSEYPKDKLDQMRALADSLGDRITKDQQVQLFTYVEELTGQRRKKKTTSCVPCITEAIRTLKNELRKY